MVLVYNRFDFDVALLVLDLHSSLATMGLATSDACFDEKAGCKVRLLGWGHTSQFGKLADKLQEAFTTSVNRTYCGMQLGADRITQSMICAGEIEGGIDTCQGDSGGPLIQSGSQVGIVSWGDGCAGAGKPGVYASTPKVLEWIQNELNKASGKGDDCDCADDGISAGISTGRMGCKKHLIDEGDNDDFCMVKGGLNCTFSSPSKPFPGASWKLCG